MGLAQSSSQQIVDHLDQLDTGNVCLDADDLCVVFLDGEEQASAPNFLATDAPALAMATGAAAVMAVRPCAGETGSNRTQALRRVWPTISNHQEFLNHLSRSRPFKMMVGVVAVRFDSKSVKERWHIADRPELVVVVPWHSKSVDSRYRNILRRPRSCTSSHLSAAVEFVAPDHHPQACPARWHFQIGFVRVLRFERFAQDTLSDKGILQYIGPSSQVTLVYECNFMDTPPRCARRNPIHDASSAAARGASRYAGPSARHSGLIPSQAVPS